jgi:hypothetical protein
VANWAASKYMRVSGHSATDAAAEDAAPVDLRSWRCLTAPPGVIDPTWCVNVGEER